jgi:glycosyltransferase involved in cell wall biosynthesis
MTIGYNQPNIPDLLASSDLFVYATPPGSNDSLPRALLEAHAAALPIVTTATAGCPEVVEEAVTGYLVSYDAHALATRALELLADPKKRREMGQLGQEHVRQRFSWQQMGAAYANLFRQILSPHTSGRYATPPVG